jgi:hypothetical protein
VSRASETFPEATIHVCNIISHFKPGTVPFTSMKNLEDARQELPEKHLCRLPPHLVLAGTCHLTLDSARTVVKTLNVFLEKLTRRKSHT